jgi:hypothetical protein
VGLPRLRRRTLVLLGALALAAAAGGVAWATVPGNEGVIHACYQKSSGILRVLDSPRDKCTRSERPIEWNVEGPQGPPGEQGLPGEPGASVGAVYAEFTTGEGGSGAISIPAGGDAPTHILTLVLPEEWSEGEQVVFATLQVANEAKSEGDTKAGAAQVDCTAGHGGISFSVPADADPIEGEDWARVVSFQAPAGGEPSIELTCSVGEEWWDQDVVVYRATLTAIPRVP